MVKLPRERWDIHLDGRVVDTVGEAVLGRDRPCPSNRVSRLVYQVTRAGERGGICRVLLVPLLEDHLPGVERQRGDQQRVNKRARR